jgi:hypothetical protein
MKGDGVGGVLSSSLIYKILSPEIANALDTLAQTPFIVKKQVTLWVVLQEGFKDAYCCYFWVNRSGQIQTKIHILAHKASQLTEHSPKDDFPPRENT